MLESQDAAAVGRLRRTAEAQLGLVSRKQALEVGVTARQLSYRLNTRELIRVCPGVYRLHGSPESWEQSLLAAVLWVGEPAVVSHRAAARLFGLMKTEDAPVELTSPSKRSWKGVKLHFGSIQPLDRATALNVIPVTTTCRTLIDLAGVLDDTHLAEALDTALRKRIVSIPWLRWRLRQHDLRTKPSTRTIRELVEDRAGHRPGSVFETRFLNALKKYRVPRPQGQFRIHFKDGPGYVDFAYPHVMVVVECDGYDYHSIKSDWLKDRQRRNELVTMGWAVFHVTWDRLVNDSETLMSDLKQLIDSRKPTLFRD